MPGIGGAAGREPVAITALLNWMSSAPSTASVFGPVKRPRPLTTPMPSALSRPGEALDDAVDDAAAVALHLLEVEVDVADPHAELREVPLRVVEGVRGLHHRLGRDAADVEAGAAHRLGLLDDHDRRTQLRRADRRWIAARP